MPVETDHLSARPRPPRRWRVPAAVAVGGAIGAPLRVEIERLYATGPTAFPLATLAINLSGALLLGALVVLLVERRTAHPILRPLLATGLLGAFTTFSTFAVEADLLARAHRVGLAALYVAASLAGGMCAAALGTVAARRAVARRELDLGREVRKERER